MDLSELNELSQTGAGEACIDEELAFMKLLENPNLVQQLTRTRENGIETIVGYFRLEFQPTEQRQILHVPFMPPFRVLPQVEANATEHDDVRVRITDCQKFGMRAEIILSKPCESLESRLIEVIATEPN